MPEYDLKSVNHQIIPLFSGFTNAIVQKIRAAKKTISVQAYSFTSEPIAQALIDAYKRKVAVEIVLDKSQRIGKYTKAGDLARSNIPVFIDAKHAIAHNKIIIIDNSTIITGSFNFTKSAEEKNAENLLVIKNQPELVKQYEANYFKHKEHSERY